MNRLSLGKLTALTLVALVSASACGGDTDESSANGTTGADSGVDVGVEDASVDAPGEVVVDVIDAGGDADRDSAIDAAVDVGVDAGVDAGFVPSSLTGLVLWLAADMGVTTGVGSSVTQWSDQSGAGNHASVADPDAQPELAPNALNGKPVIHFDGGLHYLSLPSGFANFTAGLSAFVVTRPQNNGLIHGARFFDFAVTYGSLANSVLLTRYEQADEVLYQTYPGFTPGAALDVNNVVVNGNWLTLEVIHVGGAPTSSSTAAMYKNGALVSSGSLSVPSNVTRNSNLIGRSNLAAGDAYLRGDIAELILYARSLSDAERLQVEAYLDTKWAL